MRTIRFGVIGAGLMGREFASAAARWCHLLDLDFRPEIVAVADPSEKARAWFESAISGVRLFGNAEELLAQSDIEAVYCAVPHHLHQDLYLKILRAGKHLMAEKPFGIDLAACRAITSEVEAHPESLVRCSSEFPFFPPAQRIARMIERGEFGRVIEVRAGFHHSSDLDPNKPINWKRRIATCGEYGCMGDLGMHVLHMPLRAGWVPTRVEALLSKIVSERPDGQGGMAPCETWDNAVLACETADGVPMVLETKRIAPGATNTWYLNVYGTEASAEFSTHRPKTLRTMHYQPGGAQRWAEEDLGWESAYKGITGHIFEFGFPDAILQMWAAFCDELVNGQDMKGPYRCATPSEALQSHEVFTAALASYARSHA